MFKKSIALIITLFLAACMTTGYHYAKDPHMVKKWDVTVISVKPQNIYNSVGVALVGPLASVEAKGWQVTFRADGEQRNVTIVQPSSDQYTLQAGQRAVYIIAGGRVWVQPTNYPLPPEFSSQGTMPQQSDRAAAPQVQEQKAVPPKNETPPTVTSSQQRDDSARLSKLNSLRDKGLITQEEYIQKKKEILDAL